MSVDIPDHYAHSFCMDIHETIYLQRDVLAITGLDAATLQNWVNRGLIRLDCPHPGSGQPRRYSLLDAIRLRTMGYMTCLGVRAAEAARVVEVIARDGAGALYFDIPGVETPYGAVDQPWFFWRDAQGGWQWTSNPESITGAAIMANPKEIAGGVLNSLTWHEEQS